MKNYIKYTFVVDDTDISSSVEFVDNVKKQDLKIKIAEINTVFDADCMFLIAELLREKLQKGKIPKNKKNEIVVEFNINGIKETKVLNEFVLFPYPENKKTKYKKDIFLLRNIYQDFKIYRGFPMMGRLNEILKK